MNVRIEALDSAAPDGKACKVWMDDHAVSFRTLDEARTFIDQLEARINAARPLDLKETAE